jgi:hypothetical protein
VALGAFQLSGVRDGALKTGLAKSVRLRVCQWFVCLVVKGSR